MDGMGWDGMGWDHDTIKIQEVAHRLQDVGVQALSIHGRTRVQMYKGEADWSHIAKVKNDPGIHIPIFGNGDIDSPEKALEYRNRYGVDGIMIVRASIGYPWIFDEIKHYMKTGEKREEPSLEERVKVSVQHLDFSVEWKGEKQGLFEMRRHYTNYFKGIPNFKPLRTILVESESYEEVKETLYRIPELFAEAIA